MCGRLVNLDTVARVLAEYYHLKTETQLAALDEALSKVPAVSVGGGHGKDHVADPNKMVGDLISRQAAIDALLGITAMRNTIPLDSAIFNIKKLPSAQPEIIRCKDCIYYDPPHVENNGVRYEYDEMPADAFDALGTGLVNAEYGINIGGRCCVDYYCKNYSDDKRVFVREDNYCGRAERRTDE